MEKDLSNETTDRSVALLIINLSKKLPPILILVLFCVLFSSLGIIGIDTHNNPTMMDTIEYLDDAVTIKHLGFFGFISACLKGDYKSKNERRNPLYPMLIAPLSQKNIQFFINAKKATFALGLIFVIIFYLIVFRLYGLPTAVISTALLMVNTAFLQVSTMVACEALLLIFLFLSWYCIVLGFRKRVFWTWAGVACAFAYLTKATGLLMIPMFCLSVLFYYKKEAIRVLSVKHFWGFFLAFFVIASPYLIRNIRVYHNPFYTENTKYFLVDQSQRNTSDWDLAHYSLENYLKQHSLRGIVEILFTGITERGPRLLENTFQPYPFWRNDARRYFFPGSPPLVGSSLVMAFLILSLFGFYYSRKRDEFLITIVWIGSIFLLVSWWSKAVFSTRFMLPLLPFIFVYVAKGVVLLAKMLFKRNKWNLLYLKRASVVIFVLFFLWVGICVVVNNNWNAVNIAHSFMPPENYHFFLLWLTKNVKPDDNYFIGKVFSGPLYFFEKFNIGNQYVWPRFSNTSELKDYIKDNNIKYGILDLQTFLYHSEMFKGIFGANREEGVFIMNEAGGGIYAVGGDPAKPRMFIILQFDPEKFS